jgi:FkbM family methyltransferase
MLEAGKQDLESLRFLSSFVRPGQTVFDVGAWEGPYALFFAELVGKEGRVHAFEPDPKALAALRDNIKANRLANVDTEDSCLSNADGQALFYDAGGATIGSLVRNDLVATLPQIVVKATTIDRYCRDRNIHVDGIKLDVEGAEVLAVEGAREVIRAFSPWVFLEFHGMFMPERERQRSWAKIVRSARDVTFLQGDSHRYGPGDHVDSYPDCDYFHVLIQY